MFVVNCCNCISLFNLIVISSQKIDEDIFCLFLCVYLISSALTSHNKLQLPPYSALFPGGVIHSISFILPTSLCTAEAVLCLCACRHIGYEELTTKIMCFNESLGDSPSFIWMLGLFHWGWTGTDEGWRNMSEFPNDSGRTGICSYSYIVMETLLMSELKC